MKNFIYPIILLLVIFSCTPPDVGYLSEDIHATQDTIFVPRGVFKVSATPAIENSTFPLKWEITSITDADGNPTNALQEKHEIVVWKEAFNGDTDTTLAIAENKLELSEEPSILMNEVSGEFAFTQATKFVENDIFKVNVKVSNVKGEVQLDDFVIVKLLPFEPVEFPTEMRSRLQLGKADGSFDIGYTSTITGSNDPDVPSVLDGTHPYITVTKINDEPNQGIRVNMIIADSHGTPLNPDKVVFYPSGASYLQNYHDNSVETIEDDTQTSFFLPAPPFPQFARNYTGNSSYLMYYLTTMDAFIVDKEAYEQDNGPVDWSIYTDPETGEVRNRAYIRWGIKINDTGTWEIKMRIPYTTIKED